LPESYFLPATDSVALPLLDLSGLERYRPDSRAMLRRAQDTNNDQQALERQLLERRLGKLDNTGN